MRRRTHRWTAGANPTLVEVTHQHSFGPRGRMTCACGMTPEGVMEKPTPTSRRPAPNGSVVGLDLSLRATACVSLPLAWKQDLREVRTQMLGAELTKEATQEEIIDRMIDIADGVLAFCKLVQARAIFLEDHAFGMGGQNANQTIEMTGIVKAWLREHWGVAAVPVASASARKTLLQHVPSSRGQPKGFVKKFVARNVRRLGPIAAAWNEDEIDGFVICNHGLMVRGGVAMTFLGE